MADRDEEEVSELAKTTVFFSENLMFFLNVKGGCRKSQHRQHLHGGRRPCVLTHTYSEACEWVAGIND